MKVWVSIKKAVGWTLVYLAVVGLWIHVLRNNFINTQLYMPSEDINSMAVTGNISHGQTNFSQLDQPVEATQEIRNSSPPTELPSHGNNPIFTIIILTMNRPKSLQRLLQSLEASHYDNDKVHLEIRIDYSSEQGKSKELAEEFRFSHGEKSVVLATVNLGLRGAWFKAWTPFSDEAHAIIFEDDVEVSPYWYVWLKHAWRHYGNRSDMAGISLSRQTLIPKKPHVQREIVNNHEPFLYALVGSIGFSPHPKQWIKFLAWLHSIGLDKFDVSIPGLITSDWWRKLNKRHMWTQHFIFFCQQNKLFTLHINLPNKTTLASNMREKGQHTNKGQGRDFELARNVALNFPQHVNKYGWDGKLIDESASKLKSENLNQNLMSLAKSVQAKFGFVFLQIFNTAFVEITRSWVCNIQKRMPEVMEQVMFVTTDEESLKAMRDMRIPNLIFLPFASQKLKYGERQYFDYILYRSKLIKQLLENSINVWVIESDAVWFENPTKFLHEIHGMDVVAGSDRLLHQTYVEAGFTYLNSTPATLKMWTELTNAHMKRLQTYVRKRKRQRHPGDSGSEMIMLQDYIKKVAWTVFPKTRFVSGKYYENREFRSQVTPVVIQNNWIKGINAKVHRAKKWGHWFLDSNGKCL